MFHFVTVALGVVGAAVIVLTALVDFIAREF